MMLLLRMRRKKLLLSSLTPSLSPHGGTPLDHFLLRCFSAPATQFPSPKPPHFMVDYLVNSIGFSADKATKTSKTLAHLKSPDRPDSVVGFLNHHGFDDTHIKSLISAYPTLLGYSVDKTLGPNMKALIDMGFSGLGLRQLVISNPFALILRSIVPRIGFWRTLLGNNEKKLQIAFNQNRGLINHDIAESIAPKIALLKNYGLSDQQIERIVLTGKVFMTRSMASMEALLKQTLEFGFQCSSRMFVHGLYALSCNGSVNFKAKMELLRSYGWSEHEFISAFRKAPMFVNLSKTNLRTKMEFLVERAGCTPSYIALHPLLLSFSMEKRLIPRHHVLQILKSKEVVRTMPELISIMTYSEKMFVEKFIFRYKEEAPKLHENYIVACAGDAPIEPMSKVI